MRAPRVVVDTNVIVSGLFGGGPPRIIIEAWLFGAIAPAVSRELRREVNDVLLRPAIKRMHGENSVRNVRAVVGALFNKALEVLPQPLDQKVFSDEDDHFLLELAVTAGAVAIVTGDKAMFRLRRVQGIQVLSPENFCRQFKLKPHRQAPGRG